MIQIWREGNTKCFHEEIFVKDRKKYLKEGNTKLFMRIIIIINWCSESMRENMCLVFRYDATPNLTVSPKFDPQQEELQKVICVECSNRRQLHF